MTALFFKKRRLHFLNKTWRLQFGKRGNILYWGSTLVVSGKSSLQPWLTALRQTLGAPDALHDHILGCVGTGNLLRLDKQYKESFPGARNRKYSVRTWFVALLHPACNLRFATYVSCETSEVQNYQYHMTQYFQNCGLSFFLCKKWSPIPYKGWCYVKPERTSSGCKSRMWSATINNFIKPYAVCTECM